MNELDADRSFNMIDNIFVEDALRDAQVQGNLVLIRAKVNKIHDREKSTGADDEFHSGNGPIEYTEQTEHGFVGLEAPLG